MASRMIGLWYRNNRSALATCSSAPHYVPLGIEIESSGGARTGKVYSLAEETIHEKRQPTTKREFQQTVLAANSTSEKCVAAIAIFILAVPFD